MVHSGEGATLHLPLMFTAYRPKTIQISISFDGFEALEFVTIARQFTSKWLHSVSAGKMIEDETHDSPIH